MKAIIHRNTTVWQKALKSLITDPEELFERLQLNPARLPAAKEVAKHFPLRVPLAFLSRIEQGNIDDPLLKQFLPIDAESIASKGFTNDPLQERESNPLPGLIHKYHSRVLLTLTGACAINCRYCFRREFPYRENNPGDAGWDRVIAYIEEHPEINEVIFSGGDPLILSDQRLGRLAEKLSRISHLKRLRIHSRLPIMIPDRMCDDFIDWFTTSRLDPILVIHTNHPHEIDSSVAQKLLKLRDDNITLLNQSVILKGINDNVETLVQLSEKLFQAGVLPYYLHLLDRVSGTAHFEVDENIAKQLIVDVSAQLPGYLVPKLVRDLAGSRSKMLL